MNYKKINPKHTFDTIKPNLSHFIRFRFISYRFHKNVVLCNQIEHVDDSLDLLIYLILLTIGNLLVSFSIAYFSSSATTLELFNLYIREYRFGEKFMFCNDLLAFFMYEVL